MARLAPVLQASGLRHQRLAWRPMRCASSCQAWRQLPGQGAGQEAPQAFARPGAGRVVQRGGAHVVAAVVLHHEVAVVHAGHQHPSQHAVGAAAAVSQFVGEGDALRAGDEAHREAQAHHGGPRAALGGGQAGGEQHQLEGHEQARQPRQPGARLRRHGRALQRGHQGLGQRDGGPHREGGQRRPLGVAGGRIERQARQQQGQHEAQVAGRHAAIGAGPLAGVNAADPIILG